MATFLNRASNRQTKRSDTSIDPSPGTKEGHAFTKEKVKPGSTTYLDKWITERQAGGAGGGVSMSASPKSSTTVRETQFQGPAPTLGKRPELVRTPIYDLPTYDRPEMGEIPDISLPQYDDRRVARAAQKKASLGIRQTRRALREATAGLGTDPQSAHVMRSALEQHGINIAGVMGQAESAAQVEEERRLERESRPVIMKWQADVQALRDKFQTETHVSDVQYQSELNRLHQQYLGDRETERAIWTAKLQDRNAAFESAWKVYTGKAKQVTTTTAGGGGGTASRGAGTKTSSFRSLPGSSSYVPASALVKQAEQRFGIDPAQEMVRRRPVPRYQSWMGSTTTGQPLPGTIKGTGYGKSYREGGYAERVM